ncbi:MAG: sulfotransferase family protein [Phycisphaerales bacterium JB037]
MLDLLKPYLRPIKMARLRRRARRLAASPMPQHALTGPPPGFIVGCGRSGTTILGKILQRHPEICYLFEPYHYWGVVDPRTDVNNLHHRVDPFMIMGAELVDEAIRERFHRVIMGERPRAGKSVLIEKTPHNACRIGYIRALAPTARFAHIVRDGVEVAQSIDRLASTSAYTIAGRPNMNQWWGENEIKWTTLLRDGVAAGHFPAEAPALRTHAQRGAYEWLVTMREIDRHRDKLGPPPEGDLHEFRYADLLGDTDNTLRSLASFFGASAPDTWLDESRAMIGEPSAYKARTIELPPEMAAAFNEYHERYGLAGRAEPVAMPPITQSVPA